jgi:asparagine synthase (glutamine-hydrolysing)
MPGIVGIISESPSDQFKSQVESMIRCMEYETFYASGTYFAPELGIYAGWVAAEGSFAARQALPNDPREVALLFAGECFPEAKSPSGVSRNGDSHPELGTDSLINLYQEQGDHFFERLNGLFSGLLIDRKRRRAFLFNDRYGLERLYFCETKNAFYFASEAKALLRVLPELRAFDETGVAQFLVFGCTLEWRTLFRGVEMIPGGSLWSVESGKIVKGHYFDPTSWERQAIYSTEDFDAAFEATFKRIVGRYFLGEEKVGVSLTGGLDTRMIMACRPAVSAKPICYTFSGQKVQTLDAKLAERVAGTCGLEHRTLRVDSDFFRKFPTYVDRTVYATDGYSGAIGAHEVYFNEQARKLAPIRLTGVFGSEVLRGMSTFKPVGISLDLFNPDFQRSLSAQSRELRSADEHPITFAAFREIPWNIFGSIAACRSQITFRTPFLDNEIVALAYRAPAAIRTSSETAMGLINRNDPALGRIPTDRARRGNLSGLSALLPRAWAEATFKLDYIFNEGMPDRLLPLDSLFGYLNANVQLIGRHKFLHYRRWFRNELAADVRDILSDRITRQSQFWSPQFLDRLADEHIGGHKNYVREINAILSLQAIERLLIRMSASD